MKVFRMKADLCFEAEDIDDAMRKLADHFQRATRDEEDDEQLLLPPSEIHVGPADDRQKWEQRFTLDDGELLRELVDEGEGQGFGGYSPNECVFCTTYLLADPVEHDADCLWLRAKKLVGFE